MLHLAIEPLHGYEGAISPLEAAITYALMLLITGALAYAVWWYRKGQHVGRPKSDGLRPASAADCPYCRQPFVSLQTEPAIRCPECDVKMHAECTREHGGCATYGCWHRPRTDERPLDERLAEALAESERALAEAERMETAEVVSDAKPALPKKLPQ